jgi:soluble lytic murein transglycosylase-like protein
MKLRMRVILAACGGLVLAGGAAEVWLLPRPLPSPDMPLKEKPANAMSPGEMDALLAQVAPALPAAVRGSLGNALLIEAARAGYDPLFLLAVISVESGFRISVSSERGARGLLQLKPSTFEWISAREPDVAGDDPEQGTDPIVDVRLAVRYLRWLETRFHGRDAALMAYNAGPRRYQQYVRRGEIPDSLKDYPRRVMREYTRLVRRAKHRSDGKGVLLAGVP